MWISIGGVISVKRARVEVDGRVITKGPKSDSSRRTVDLDVDTTSMLRRWKVRQAEERLPAGAAWTQGDWVITNEIGEPYRPGYLTKRFTKMIKPLDLPATDIKGLRHAHATALLLDGAHLLSQGTTQHRLGHLLVCGAGDPTGRYREARPVDEGSLSAR